MLSFKSYITEGFKNFIGASSIEDRRKWADEVWELLQSSYAKIGGIKGNSFNSKEDMINNIPFWKIFVRNNKVICVFMYKDKDGRKGVACGSDKTPEARTIMADVFTSNLKVSYGEKSKAALVFAMRVIPWDIIKQYLITIDEVKRTLHEDDIIVPDDAFVQTHLDKDDNTVWKRFPQLHPYFYVRIIGGHLSLKVAIGTVGKNIT